MPSMHTNKLINRQENSVPPHQVLGRPVDLYKEHRCSECPHKNITCSVRHRMGHLAKVCRDKNSTNNDASGNNPRRQSQFNPTQRSHKTHLIVRTGQEESAVDEQLQILATHVTPNQREGAVVHAKLNGHPVNM